MNALEKFLKNFNEKDFKDLVSKFHAKIEKENEENLIFWNNNLCQSMINDMIIVNEGFDGETFSYFPYKIKNLYGWKNITNSEIQQFINVMSDNNIGLSNKLSIDEKFMFDNYNFIKKGIHVFIMHGQGTFIRLTPNNTLVN